MNKELSGQIEEKNGRWWAYCDQHPLAAHGASHAEALFNMMKMVDQYLEALEASKSAALQAVTSKKGSAHAPWRFTLQAA